MYDHAIFATYSLSAMTLMVVVLSIAGLLGLPNALRSRPQRAAAGNRQKDPDIAPFQP